jgi:5-methylthioadenosine/S-adenosylhomocysteine deaminase
MKIDTLINARWIIPVQPSNVIHENYSLAIKDGRIIDLLPSKLAIDKYSADTVEQLSNHALIPGLINAHTHAAMSLLRGIADDLPLKDWLENHIWPLEQQWVGEDFVRDGAELAIAEMIRSGTTCFNDMYFFPEITAQQVIKTGIRAGVGLIIIDFPTAWAETSEQYIEKGLALHERLRHEPLISTLFAPHAPYTVSDEPLNKIRMLSDELEIPMHMHVHEIAYEVEQAVSETGHRPLHRLNDLGLINPGFIAVHMTQISEQEIELMANTGAHIVHCPESNLKLASGFCPVAQYLDAGINVALGTDGAASNNDLDMIGEMHTAALLGKAVANDAGAVSAATVLAMATLNGAKAMHLDHEIGSLVIGKSADITAIDLGELETQPLYNPIAQIVYSATRSQVTDVWVAGRQLLKQRKLTTIDQQQLRVKIDAWQHRLKP